MTQLALTSKDFFFFTLHAKRLLFALKVFSKFYKLILARGFIKRPRRPTTSFPLFSSALFFFSFIDLGKISDTHGVRVSRSVVELHYKFHFLRRRTRRTSGVQMQKERREGGTEIHRGEEEKEVWKKPKMSRVITAKSLNKHV